MKLLTAENRKKLPPLYSQEKLGYDAIAYVKFFGGGRFTFFATEFDGKDTFFGYVVSPLGEDCDELAYASLAAIESLRFPPFNLPAERDLHFEPKPLREALREHGLTVREPG